jgi:hypothetical protein
MKRVVTGHDADTIAYINKCYKYVQDTGTVMRIAGRSPGVGKPVGTIGKDGYVRASVVGRSIGLHTVVWILCKKSFPIWEIDHIDRNRSNNRIENLRDVPQRVNAANNERSARGRKTGTRKENNKWLAVIRVHNRTVRIGLFTTEQAASDAYEKRKWQVINNEE